MTENAPIPGRLCLSRAGRDAGKYYIVTRLAEDAGYVYIADGRSRRIEKPKRKKLKHLHMTPIVLDEAARRIRCAQELSDGELYAMIRRTGRVKDEEVD